MATFGPFFQGYMEAIRWSGEACKSYSIAFGELKDTWKHKSMCFDGFFLVIWSMNFGLKSCPKIGFCCLWRKKCCFFGIFMLQKKVDDGTRVTCKKTWGGVQAPSFHIQRMKPWEGYDTKREKSKQAKYAKPLEIVSRSKITNKIS